MRKESNLQAEASRLQRDGLTTCPTHALPLKDSNLNYQHQTLVSCL